MSRRQIGVALTGILLLAFLDVSPSSAGGLDVVGTPHCSVAERLPPPPADRPVYRLVVRAERNLVDFSGALTVTFKPAVATDRIVFRLWPNATAFGGTARLTIGAVTSGGRPLGTTRPALTTLVVNRAVRARERVTLSMPWTLHVSRRAGLAIRGGGGSARLVSFFPLLAWDGAGWATDPPLRHMDSVWPTSPTSDFDVRVVAPRGLQVLATGEAGADGRWRARGVRDFALAIGSFRIARTVVRAPDPVRVVVGLERDSAYPIQSFVDETKRSLRNYAQRFGPYPWATYTLLAMTDFSSLAGFAYSTIGFVGDSSVVLVPHETAHQWFQSLVGNNQSRDPWLSEGLATWAEAGLGGPVDGYRGAIPDRVRNRLGEPVRFFDPLGFEHFRLGVYVQAVQALSSLGDSANVDCALRTFVARNAHRVAVPRDLLEVLDDFFPEAETVLRGYGARF